MTQMMKTRLTTGDSRQGESAVFNWQLARIVWDPDLSGCPPKYVEAENLSISWTPGISQSPLSAVGM